MTNSRMTKSAMMDCQEILLHLDDYHDGELAAAARRAVEEHLDDCPACREELDGLRALSRAAGDLPREIPPERELWARIEGRLAPRRWGRLLSFPSPFSAPGRQVFLYGGAAALAAALALAIGLAFWPPGPPSHPGAPRRDPAAATATSVSETLPTAAGTAELAASIEAVQVDLRQALDRRRGDLTPETLAVVESNLAVIDRAIGEILVALENEPGNRELNLLLAAQYHHEVQLLHQLSRL